MNEPDPVTSLGDADLNLTIAEAARTEAASAGRRLAAIAELAHRRLGSKLAAERERWGCDATDSCAAEVAADLTITTARPSPRCTRGWTYATGSPWSESSCDWARFRCALRPRRRGGPG